MTPNPPDETLEGDISGSFGPLSARYGLRIAHGLRIVAGLGSRPDCRIADHSRTWAYLHQARRALQRREPEGMRKCLQE
eukprot:7843534-Alexandrium_andersonii.AAC.1